MLEYALDPEFGMWREAGRKSGRMLLEICTEIDRVFGRSGSKTRAIYFD